MFQKLWKFNSSQTALPPGEPEDHGVFTKVKPVHASFNKGIPLNMKIVIRGDIRTGKTSVFERLQGLAWREHDYRTTSQIQVANIPWQYPHTNDIIKVEVWDVVDKAVQPTNLKTSSNSTALKIDNIPKAGLPVEPVPHAGFSLDASTIDVYRNTDGVILIYDGSKPWTFDYAAKALSEIPVSMPILILSNFMDNSKPALASDRVEVLIKEHNDFRRKQPNAPANLIRHLNTSMRTGLGLKEIHESLGIPFLNVLRETHRKQFEQKTREIEKLLKALDGHTQKQHAQRPVNEQQQQADIIQPSPSSSKGVVPPRKPLPSCIQTTGKAIHPIPLTSSPTSPARKTRNEHTNVDILSPTPVSAHAPTILFDFPGKLEEDFFQNIDTGSSAMDTASDHQGGPIPTQSTNEATPGHQAEIRGNPMVATDEDIEDDVTERPFHRPSPTWIHHAEEEDLLSHRIVEGAGKEKDDLGDDVQKHQRYCDDEHGEMAEDSANSTLESIPPLRHTLQDSDLESQPDFPIASAMLYEHAFVGTDGLRLSGKHPLHTGLGGYEGFEDIAGGHMNNPWESAGDLQSGISVSEPAGDTIGCLNEEPLGEEPKEAKQDPQVFARFSRDGDHLYSGDLEDIEEDEEPAEEKKVKRKSKRKGRKRK